MTTQTYNLSSRTLKLDTSFDVVVVGGGPSGCAAAAASAREGARTLLIESTGALGGSGTNALVPAWCPFSDKTKILYGGLAEEVFNSARKDMQHVPDEWVDWCPIDAERLKVVYDRLVSDSGASILFQTMLSAVERDEDGVVEALIVSNKSGLTAIKAKVYIDCTGDADLAAWAGSEFITGGDDGQLMPATHCFVLSNVDDYTFSHKYKGGTMLESSYPLSPLRDIAKCGRYPLILDNHLCCTLIGPGTVGFNAGHLYGVDGTDPKSMSAAQIRGRQLARQYRDALAEICPDAFGAAFLVATGSVVGIRETRRIVGDYVLTIEDYLARRSFADEICRNCYFIDIHQSLADIQKKTKAPVDELRNLMRYSPGESHGIPYRCLTSAKLRNVLVAGRSISCDRSVQGSIRVMPVCLAMGQAAGTAAALASSGSGDVRMVDVKLLRQRLKMAGAFLPDLS